MAALVRREWTPSISGKRVEERRGVPSGITQDVKDYFESWAVSVVLERETGIEPATSSLGSWRSTAELLPLNNPRLPLRGKAMQRKRSPLSTNLVRSPYDGAITSLFREVAHGGTNLRRAEGSPV